MVWFVNVRLRYKIASKMAVFGQNGPFYFKNNSFSTNSDQFESKFGSIMVVFDIKMSIFTVNTVLFLVCMVVT